MSASNIPYDANEFTGKRILVTGGSVPAGAKSADTSAATAPSAWPRRAERGFARVHQELEQGDLIIGTQSAKQGAGHERFDQT